MKPKVAFVCVHNSCRSQIAEALAGIWREIGLSSILPEQKQNRRSIDAVRLMKQLYGIDMEQSQYSKTIDKIPAPDIVISMGCDVECPVSAEPLMTIGASLILQAGVMNVLFRS